MARRKKKRQKSRLKHASLCAASKVSIEDHALAQNLSNIESPCLADSSLSLIAPLELSDGRRYKVSRKHMHE